MHGRLELNVKFSELPRPLRVHDGMKIGIQTSEGIVTTILTAKTWRKLEKAAQTYPHWIATLTGVLDQRDSKQITLKQPILQVFEKKPKLASGSGASAPLRESPDGTASAVAGPIITPQYPKLSLKGRGAAKSD